MGICVLVVVFLSKTNVIEELDTHKRAITKW